MVIFLLVALDSTARALPVLVLLREETVGRMSRDFLVFYFIDSRMLLAVGIAFAATLMAAYFF